MDLTKYHEIWFILKDYCYRTEGLFGKAYMQSISRRIVEALEHPIKSEKYCLGLCQRNLWPVFDGKKSLAKHAHNLWSTGLDGQDYYRLGICLAWGKLSMEKMCSFLWGTHKAKTFHQERHKHRSLAADWECNALSRFGPLMGNVKCC